jgi:hypothetical protein
LKSLSFTSQNARRGSESDEVFGQRHTIQVAERLGDMGAQGFALISLASDRAIALTWPMAPWAVNDAQEAHVVDDVAPEH